MNGQLSVTVVHAVAFTYSLLIYIFAALEWAGNEFLNGLDWIAVIVVALVVSISQLVTVLKVLEGKQPSSASLRYAIWHLVRDIFFGALLLVYFGGHHDAHVNETAVTLPTPVAVRQFAQLVSLMISFAQLFFIDLALFLAIFF